MANYASNMKDPQLEGLMKTIDDGVKSKPKATATPTPVETPDPNGKPTKYTVPRLDSESLAVFGDRLDGLVKAWKAKQ